MTTRPVIDAPKGEKTTPTVTRRVPLQIAVTMLYRLRGMLSLDVIARVVHRGQAAIVQCAHPVLTSVTAAHHALLAMTCIPIATPCAPWQIAHLGRRCQFQVMPSRAVFATARMHSQTRPAAHARRTTRKEARATAARLGMTTTPTATEAVQCRQIATTMPTAYQGTMLRDVSACAGISGLVDRVSVAHTTMMPVMIVVRVHLDTIRTLGAI